MLTVREVADRLRCAPSTVYQLVESGKLGAYHIGPSGGSIRVSEEQLRQYLDACRTQPRSLARAPARPKLKHLRL